MENHIINCEDCFRNKEIMLAANPGKDVELFFTFTCNKCLKEGRRMCKRCDTFWYLEDFSGSREFCRECFNTNERNKYQENNPDAISRTSIIVDETKKCNKCKFYKPFDEFPDLTDRNTNICSICTQFRKKNPKNPQNKPPIVLTITEKLCEGDCNQVLPIEKFSKMNSGNRRNKCNKCSRPKKKN